MYSMFVKRKQAEAIEQRRTALVTGAWANANVENIDELVTEIDEAMDAMLDKLYGDSPDEEREEIPFEDPLFAPLKQTVYAEPLTEEEIERERERQRLFARLDQGGNPLKQIPVEIDQSERS